jgi:hypothetical protein
VVSSSSNNAGVKRWGYDSQTNSVSLYLDNLRDMPRQSSNPLQGSAGAADAEAAYVCVQFAATRSALQVAQAAPALSSLSRYYEPSVKAAFSMQRSAVSNKQAPMVDGLSGGASTLSPPLIVLAAAMWMARKLL